MFASIEYETMKYNLQWYFARQIKSFYEIFLSTPQDVKWKWHVFADNNGEQHPGKKVESPLAYRPPMYIVIHYSERERRMKFFQEKMAYLHMVWHDLDIKGYMKPCFRRIEQKVLRLTGIDICILMNVIGKRRFLTCVSKESSSKRLVKHFLHHQSCLPPLLI